MRFTWRKANFWESGDICNMSMINCRMDFCGDFMLDENDISTAKGEEVCCFIVYHPQGTQGQSVGPEEMA